MENALATTDRLRPKEITFVNEYIKTSKVTQSAVRAGYSPNGAHVTGSRLLQTAKIQSAIREQYRKQHMCADEVLARLSALARLDLGEYIDQSVYGKPRIIVDSLDPKTGQVTRTDTYGLTDVTVGETFVSLKGGSQIQALTTIGKHLGLFTDRVDVTHTLKQYVDVDYKLIEAGGYLLPAGDQEEV